MNKEKLFVVLSQDSLEEISLSRLHDNRSRMLRSLDKGIGHSEKTANLSNEDYLTQHL